MLPGFYILEHKIPTRVDNIMIWGKYWDDNSKQVARTQLTEDVLISTVFLGMDHGWSDRPLFFETMIFGGKQDGYQVRYSTYEEAEDGHKEVVEMATAALYDQNTN